MSYNDPNQFGKGKGKNKKFGSQAEDTTGTPAGSEYRSQGENTGAEPWKQKLQDISLEGDEQKETDSSSSYGSTQKEKGSDSYSSEKGDSTKKEKGSDSYQSGSYGKKNRAGSEGEGREEEGGEEEEQEEEGLEGKAGRFAEMGKKRMKQLGEAFENADKTKLAKYAALGVLVLMGMRKNSFLAGLAVTIAAGVLSKSLLEDTLSEEEEGETENEETEAVPA